MDLKLEVPQGQGAALRSCLAENGHEATSDAQEALGWPEVIVLAAASLQAIDIVYSWLRRLREKNKSITVVVCLEDGTRLDLSEVPKEQVVERLQSD